MKNKKIFSVQMITEAGVMLALAFVLSLIKVYKMPYGGSISLEMIPIIIFSIRWGFLPAIITGSVYGFIKLMIDPVIYHPIQLLLDYPLPSAFMAFSAFSYLKDKTKYQGYIPFIVIAYVLKFITHYLSGVIYFPQYAPEGMSPYWYSFIYNIQYNGPELIICIIAVILLWKPLSSIIKKNN